MDFDIFLSHASEDKASVVRPLVSLLRARNLRVWLDESELKLGDSLRAAIDRALSRSRFGLVVLSPAFLSKQWTRKELSALVARDAASADTVILPIWHNLTARQVAKAVPMLADAVAVSTAQGLSHVADRVELAVASRAGAEGRVHGRKQPAPHHDLAVLREKRIEEASFRLRRALLTYKKKKKKKKAQSRTKFKGTPLEPVGRSQFPLKESHLLQQISKDRMGIYLWEGQLSPTLLQVMVDVTDIAMNVAEEHRLLSVEIAPLEAIPVLPEKGHWFRSRAKDSWQLTRVERDMRPLWERFPPVTLPYGPRDRRPGEGELETLFQLLLVAPAKPILVSRAGAEILISITLEGDSFNPVSQSWALPSPWAPATRDD